MNLNHFCRLQLDLSHYFSAFTKNGFVPLLIIFIGSSIFFIFRSRNKDLLRQLPLEFGILNFLFLPVGTILFFAGLIVESTILALTGGSLSSESVFIFNCITTRGFWPGLIAIILASAGLFLSQATGWLGRLTIRLSSQMLKYGAIILLIPAGICSLLTLPFLLFFI